MMSSKLNSYNAGVLLRPCLIPFGSLLTSEICIYLLFDLIFLVSR